MSNIFTKAIESFTPYRDMLDALERGQTPLAVSGVSAIHKAHFALGLRKKSPVLMICDSEASASKLAEDINALSGETCAFLYPAKDFSFTPAETVSREYEHIRLGVLSRLASEEPDIFVCASAEAAMQRTVPKSALLPRTVTVEAGGTVSLAELAAELTAAGYSRCEKAEGASQFSVRGSIADIFPVGSPMPVRMELWGDEIDTLSYFDTESQRRTDPVDRIRITPAMEMLFDSPDALADALEKLSASLLWQGTATASGTVFLSAISTSTFPSPTKPPPLFLTILPRTAPWFSASTGTALKRRKTFPRSTPRI